MGIFGSIGDWDEGRLNNWMQQRFNLQGNVRQLISRAVQDATVPSGSVIMGGWASAPGGYVLCDGASYLRSDYQPLFDEIGTAYGAVDGSHFNVPDFTEKMPIMPGTHPDIAALGDTGGAWAATHTHGIPATTSEERTDALIGAPGTFDGGGANRVVPWDPGYKTHVHDVAAGTSGAETARPPWLTVNFAIKV